MKTVQTKHQLIFLIPLLFGCRGKNQTVIFDGNGPDAKLMGFEYIITE